MYPVLFIHAVTLAIVVRFLCLCLPIFRELLNKTATDSMWIKSTVKSKSCVVSKIFQINIFGSALLKELEMFTNTCFVILPVQVMMYTNADRQTVDVVILENLLQTLSYPENKKQI